MGCFVNRLSWSLIDEFYKYIIFPLAFYEISIFLEELAPSIEHIVHKLSLDIFACSEYDFSMSVFVVIEEISFVLNPIVFKEVPVVIGEFLF